MEITEVRVRLVNGGAERLRAFCSVTLDGDFVIRDLKVIEGTNGYFVAMPSRKLAYRCGRCGNKNHLRAKFCNECGGKLSERRPPRDQQGRSKLHVDVAHPINTACRERIQKSVIEAFNAEMEKAKLPDYQPATGGEDDDFEGGSEYSDLVAELKETAAKRHEERRGGRVAEPRVFEPDDALPEDEDAEGTVEDDSEELEEVEMVEDEEQEDLDDDQLDDEPASQPAMGRGPRVDGNRADRGNGGNRGNSGRGGSGGGRRDGGGQRFDGNRRDQGPPGDRRDHRGPRDGNRDSRGPARQDRGDRRPPQQSQPPREREVEQNQGTTWTPAPPPVAPPPPPAPTPRREEPADDGGADFAAGLLD